MKIPGFVLTLFGWLVKKKLDLQEGPMDSSKPWYKSVTMWSNIANFLIAVVGLVDLYFTQGKIATSPAYLSIVAILNALGIYGRKTATTTIG